MLVRLRMRFASLSGLLTFLFFLFLGTVTASGQAAREPIDVDSLGPQVGEPVPDFSLPDQTGTLRTRGDILGPRGALILFHRSADW